MNGLSRSILFENARIRRDVSLYSYERTGIIGKNWNHWKVFGIRITKGRSWLWTIFLLLVFAVGTVFATRSKMNLDFFLID